MPELITLGETMAAFTPTQSGRLRYQRHFEMRIAGAESNTAIGVQKLGHSAGFLTRLGQDEFGDFVLAAVRAEGVDTSRVLRDAARRTGVMFKETSGGATKVFYYRDGSAASAFSPEDLDREYLGGARILHLSGITPVLSESCLQTVQAAIAMAEDAGVLVSFDPNIRRKLWGERELAPTIRALCAQADIVLLGLDEAKALYGCESPEQAASCIFSAKKTAYAVVKDGEHGAWCFSRDNTAFIPPFPCACVDPVGAGDAFNAGFLCGLLEQLSLEECGRLAGLAGAMATECFGDIESLPTRRELERLLHNQETIQR